jgi:prevent-host-death family protein
MTSVTAFDAKTRFGQLLRRVSKGEEIIITRHERPVARLVPEGRGSLQSVRKAAAGLRELRQRIASRTAGKPKLSYSEIKSCIAEGRW